MFYAGTRAGSRRARSVRPAAGLPAHGPYDDFRAREHGGDSARLDGALGVPSLSIASLTALIPPLSIIRLLDDVHDLAVLARRMAPEIDSTLAMVRDLAHAADEAIPKIDELNRHFGSLTPEARRLNEGLDVGIPATQRLNDHLDAAVPLGVELKSAPRCSTSAVTKPCPPPMPARMRVSTRASRCTGAALSTVAGTRSALLLWHDD